MTMCLFFAVIIICMLSTVEPDTTDEDADLDDDNDDNNTNTNVNTITAGYCESNTSYYCFHNHNPYCRFRYRRADYNNTNRRGCVVVTKCQYNEAENEIYKMRCYAGNSGFTFTHSDIVHHIVIKLLTADGSTFRTSRADSEWKNIREPLSHWIMDNSNDQVTSFVVTTYTDCNLMRRCLGPLSTESPDDDGVDSNSLTTVGKETGVRRYDNWRNCPSEEIRRCEATFHSSCTKTYRESNESIAYGCLLVMKCDYDTRDSRIGVLCFVEDNAFPTPGLLGLNETTYVYRVVVTPRGHNGALATTEFTSRKSAALPRIRQAINSVSSSITSFTVKTYYNCSDMAACILPRQS